MNGKTPVTKLAVIDQLTTQRVMRRPEIVSTNARPPYPFAERQFARLLVIRGRIRDNVNCFACYGERAA